MENLPSELKIELMKYCDSNALINLSFSCKNYQNEIHKIKRYITGLNHPDSYIQLCILKELLHKVENGPFELINYYPILIKQLQDYISHSHGSVRNLYANLLIGIIAAKKNDKDNLKKICNSLYKECIEEAGSKLLLQYLLEKIKIPQKDRTILAAIETKILAKINEIKGPYNTGENNIKKKAWLFKLTLLNFDQIKEKRDTLLDEIAKWFTAQDESTSGNFAVMNDMFLNIRWLTQNMTQTHIQRYVSQQLLPSLLPLSTYNFRSRKKLCLENEVALHILSLVGVEYFNELITKTIFEISYPIQFLSLLTKTQTHSALNAIISANPNYFFDPSNDTWDRLNVQVTTSEKIIEKLDDTTRKVIFYPNIDELLNDLEQTKNIENFIVFLNFLSKKPINNFNEDLLKRIYRLALTIINSQPHDSFKPWILKKLLSHEQYAVIENQYVNQKLSGNNFNSIFGIISSAENKDNLRSAIKKLKAKLKSKSMDLCELNNIATDFNDLLTANMRKILIKKYNKLLSKEIKSNVTHEFCRTGLKILKRWHHLDKLEKRVKKLITEKFNAINFNDDSAYQFDTDCTNANVYMRFYLELFNENETILCEKFYIKLKPTLNKILFGDVQYSCHESTENDLFNTLFTLGASIAKNIIQDLWLPILDDNQILHIETIAKLVQFCLKNIPQQMITTEIVPKLILHINNKTVAYCLMKIYNSLTDKQREQLAEKDSPLKDIFIQFYQLCTKTNDRLPEKLTIK